MQAQSPIEVSKVLTDAADYLMVNGWVKDSWGEDGGPRCIMGAIASIEGVSNGFGRIFDPSYAQGSLAYHLGDFPQYWNDRKCQDEYEAIDCLKSAAKAVANGEIVPVPLFVFAEDQANLEMSA